MKLKTQLALMAILISFAAHVYLTLHYYPLKFGFEAAQSACNLNATFNCDSVATSNYAHAFGIPLALWGAMVQLVLFYFVLMGWLEWSEYPERTRRAGFVLASLSLFASVVMAVISLAFLKTYCIVCMGLYALSLVTFWACRGLLREPFWMHFKRDLPVLWDKARDVVIAFAIIPVGTYLAHQAFLVNYDAEGLQKQVDMSLAQWSQAPAQNFVAKPMLSLGPAEGAALTLVEFADFTCGHCAHASHSLDAFAHSHPDVRFEFYAFPLDSKCNAAMNDGNGVPCHLAFAVTCAEKENRGWELHHAIFEDQASFYVPNVTAADGPLAKHVTALGLSWERLQACMADSSTQDAVKAQAKQGGLVNISGTPTIFANGRQLPGGQLIQVLEGAREAALQKR